MRTFSPVRGRNERSQLVAISLLSGSTNVTGTGSRNTALARFVAEDRVDECLGLERREIVRALAQTNELDRHAELALYGDDDAALRRTVELRQHDAGDV